MQQATVRIVDRGDHVVLLAGRRLYLDFGIQRLADQGSGQGRVDADQALAQIQFVRADDAIASFAPIFVFHCDPGAENRPCPRLPGVR